MKTSDRFAVVLLLLLGGCSEPSGLNGPMLDLTINGKTVYYATNQIFLLELDVAADAGYMWDYSISDTNVVRVDSTGYRPKSDNRAQEGVLQ